MSFFKNEIARLKLKQGDITEICGVRRQTVTSWSNGETPIPSDKLAILAKIGVDVQYVITGVRSPSFHEQRTEKITREQLIFFKLKSRLFFQNSRLLLFPRI